MAARTALSQTLPASHYFFTVSRGAAMRTVAVRAAVVWAALVLAPVLAAVGVGSTLYLSFHDDLVAELMQRQSAQQYAYEDRIAVLRQDLERQGERARADDAALGERVRELFGREAKLEDRAATLASLGAEAPPRRSELPAAVAGGAPVPPHPAALGFAPSDKPRPVIEPATRGPGAWRAEDHASLIDDPGVPLGARLDAVRTGLDRTERGQLEEVARLGVSTRTRAARIGELIAETGLSLERFTGKPVAQAVGGPFVPLPQGAEGAFDRAVAELRGVAATAAQLGAALPRLPLAAPLDGRLEVTSPFGPRTDPFLGRPSLHTGVDLREGYGTDIRATGGGRVVFAGMAGGYGNMVEIDHGDGVATRYAHMGGIAVAEGQSVARGAVLGFVGATGRATGPHLHYEVRIDGEPVDPTRFLAGAERLASLDAH